MPKIDTNRKNSILQRLDTAFSIARLQLTSVGELNIKASLFIRRSDMKNMRVLLKPVGIFLAFFLFILSGPYQSAMAAMIGTEAVVDADGAQGAREYLNSFLAREDVRNALIAQGIDPGEAKNRIDSLTDQEAQYVADQLEQLPAGGNFFVTLLVIAFIVFVILLITDITGYTDIFPFVKKK
jgi:hypothetical protein